ncbi:MAG: hypothetical protein LQ349_004738 [Xanthoria aureola]|nr:MAG: hypothetical protein LQ349_004738 [Xanthoria aureola]
MFSTCIVKNPSRDLGVACMRKMRHPLLFRSYAAKNIFEGVITIRPASRKHHTASDQRSYFREHISYSRSPPQLQDHSSQHPRLASTRTQKPAPDYVPSSSLSSTIEDEVLSRTRIVLRSLTVPDTAEVEGLLLACEVFARRISEEVQPLRQTTSNQTTPASNLLSLEESQDDPQAGDQKDVFLTVPAKAAAAQVISSTAHQIITDPKIYITPKLLSTYVNVQSLLGRPGSLPEAFQLYASKPFPKSKTAPLVFATPNSNKPTAHIPLSVANTALNAAIQSKNLPLCFDIINYSVCARAFQYQKFLRRAFIPISGAVLAPFAVYKLASELSGYLSNMDAAVATDVLFAGMLAYLGFTATIGVVAVTTSNDQMDRVTWASGTPLRERWMREEERMLIDRVAGAWGFQQRSRRGEEEGPDWEALREWVGMRGMILDRTELMDGME